jgi:predicted GIY-YIG superfamily endonuclease
MTASDVKTALYRHYDKNDVLLYVGISVDYLGRYEKHTKISSWAYESSYMKIEWFSCRFAALAAEKVAIREELPLHNVVYGNKERKHAIAVPDTKKFLAVLKSIANKQTLFFQALLEFSCYEEYTGLITVNLPPRIKRKILEDIGCVSKNPLNLAKGHIKSLIKAKLIRYLGQGSYAVHPLAYSRSLKVTKAEYKKAVECWKKSSNTGEIVEVINN